MLNYYSSAEECKNAHKNKKQTNPLYKDFTQTHFTAGDEHQFEERRMKKNNNEIKDLTIDKSNLFINHSLYTPFEKNCLITENTVSDTFAYIFHKLKKGIFVKIMNNELKVFLPFSNHRFRNEWSSLIFVDSKYKSVYDFFKHVQELAGYPYVHKNINSSFETWYANNSLFRYEYPIFEGETNITNIADMLICLLKNRKVPDIEFFVNRRDFPLLTRNGTEPYFHIFGKDKPLISHKYEKYSPILSNVFHANFADIAIPTGDDWAYIEREKEKYFFGTEDRNFNIIPTPWKSKKSIAIFRGSSTGAGTTVENNPRLKISKLSTEYSDILDAGITSWNIRPRKMFDDKYMRTVEYKELPFGLVNSLSPQQQSEHKFIVHIEGHVSAFRLSYELGFNSCLLIVDSDYKLWFQQFLKPFVHYVPVKHDLSDLIEKIKWCQNNDDKCKKIAKEAKKFHDTYINEKGIFDYLQKILFDLKKQIGNYQYPKYSLEEKNSLIMKPFILKYRKNLVKEKKLNFVKQIWKGKGITIDEFVFDKVKTHIIAKKFEPNPKRENEKCIGLILNSLKIPNFAHTFGWYKNTIYMNKLNGGTLKEYIHSKDYSFPTLCFLLEQIILALLHAQEKLGFIHYDISPWNIILTRQEPKTYYYNVRGQVYKIHTGLVPVIIDYGYSRAIRNGVVYGSHNIFEETNVDFYSLIITVASELIDYRSEYNNCCWLVGYYLHDKKNLKKFLETERKFSNLLYGKNRLKQLDGFGLLKYFLTKTKTETIRQIPDTVFETVKKIDFKCSCRLEQYYLSVFTKNFPKENIKILFDEKKMKYYDCEINIISTAMSSKFITDEDFHECQSRLTLTILKSREFAKTHTKELYEKLK